MRRVDKKVKIALLVGYLLVAGGLASGVAIGTAFASEPVGDSLGIIPVGRSPAN